jgi:hypothetical protein
MNVTSREAITGLVQAAVKAYAAGFQARHEGEHGDPNGTINMKIHNVFIAALGPEIQYYTALCRSLDSSLGNMLEGLAIDIATLFYDVRRNVEGPLSVEQTKGIAELLEQYRRHEQKPQASDYDFLRAKPTEILTNLRHDSDYYLTDKETGNRYLIELKIGGDLDNKKARSEKEAILEQFAILSNTVPPETPITVFFATAYNRFGEDKAWKQERVRQFFADEELLIGRDFWNFVSKSPDGYDLVLRAYRDHAGLIKDALGAIKGLYLAA